MRAVTTSPNHSSGTATTEPSHAAPTPVQHQVRTDHHRTPASRVATAFPGIPTCRQAWTAPIPDCNICQYLRSTSSCRLLPARPTATPSPNSRSVATSPRTQVPPHCQFSLAVGTVQSRRPVAQVARVGGEQDLVTKSDDGFGITAAVGLAPAAHSSDTSPWLGLAPARIRSDRIPSWRVLRSAAIPG